jgi:hypothetical protein
MVGLPRLPGRDESLERGRLDFGWGGHGEVIIGEVGKWWCSYLISYLLISSVKRLCLGEGEKGNDVGTFC